VLGLEERKEETKRKGKEKSLMELFGDERSGEEKSSSSSRTIMILLKNKAARMRAGVARGPTGGKGEDPRKERRSWAVAHKSRVACSHRVLAPTPAISACL
jgi:hypothetical protein